MLLFVVDCLFSYNLGEGALLIEERVGSFNSDMVEIKPERKTILSSIITEIIKSRNIKVEEDDYEKWDYFKRIFGMHFYGF